MSLVAFEDSVTQTLRKCTQLINQCFLWLFIWCLNVYMHITTSSHHPSRIKCPIGLPFQWTKHYQVSSLHYKYIFCKLMPSHIQLVPFLFALPLKHPEDIQHYLCVCVCVSDCRGQCEADPGLCLDRPVGGGDGEQRRSEGDSCFWCSDSLHRTLHPSSHASQRLPRYQKHFLFFFSLASKRNELQDCPATDLNEISWSNTGCCVVWKHN